MTPPEQRASECLHAIKEGEGMLYTKILIAINAAVEEARAEERAEEREACAQIADNLRDAFKAQAAEKAMGGNADQVIEEYAGAVGTAELISMAIRARSEEKN
jgi:hypothetical protein